MKKRLISLLVAGMTLLAMAGCGAATPETTETRPTTETTVAATELSAEEQQILTQRREAVVQRMRDMTTFLWRSDVDITYSKQRSSTGPENDDQKNVITLKAGRLYSGLPYTHGGSSIYDWQKFATQVDENGIYHVSGITGDMLTGYDIWEPHRAARLGTDCADAVSWAWGAVSSSMNCTQTYEMNEAHGCIPVGVFEHDTEKHSATIQVCESNGMNVMFAAYAQLQPGDAVVHNNTPDGGSHAMLVSEVVVPQKSNGEPDYVNAYILTVHQTSGNLFGEKSYFDQELGEEVFYCGGVDDKYLFIKLYEKGYLPFTVKELIDPAPLEEEWVKDSVAGPSLETMFDGTFTANYPISNVTVTIMDEAGQTLQQGTCFATETELKCFDLAHFTDPVEQTVMRGALDVEQLAAGTYRCTFVCQLSTGKELTVRDFTFTK